MKIPKVSVVTTCYNSERFLREAIDSILNQTFTDFEYIIWNDGSTDKTEEIVKSYNDPRIRYFKTENQGVGSAAHAACAVAKGEYIARLDDDDICFPQRLEKEVYFLDTHPDYVLVSCLFEYIDEHDRVFGQCVYPCTSKAIKKRLNILHSGAVYRKSAYEQCGGYVNVRMGLDKILWGRMAKYGKYANLPEILVQYRIQHLSIGRKLREPNYNNILGMLMTKIINDDKVNPEDVAVYNKVWKMNMEASRSLPDFITKSVLVRRQQAIVNILSKIIGNKTATKLLSKLKSFLIDMGIV